MFFCQNAVVLRCYKNILFLISISWSLLCEFNTKIFTFPLPLLPKSVCFVTYWLNNVTVTTKFYRWKPCTACNDGRQCQMLSFWDCIMVFGPVIWCRVFVILPWFLRFSQKFAVFILPFLPWFSTVPTHHVGGRWCLIGQWGGDGLWRWFVIGWKDEGGFWLDSEVETVYEGGLWLDGKMKVVSDWTVRRNEWNASCRSDTCCSCLVT